MADGGMAATTYMYSAPYYNPTSVVEAYHSIPRFGHTPAISSLASFDNDEQVDYAVGLVFLASVVLCFFLFWAIALIVFACMGQEQVGFLAGRGFVQPMSKTYGPGDDLGASRTQSGRRIEREPTEPCTGDEQARGAVPGRRGGHNIRAWLTGVAGAERGEGDGVRLRRAMRATSATRALPRAGSQLALLTREQAQPGLAIVRCEWYTQLYRFFGWFAASILSTQRGVACQDT